MHDPSLKREDEILAKWDGLKADMFKLYMDIEEWEKWNTTDPQTIASKANCEGSLLVLPTVTDISVSDQIRGLARLNQLPTCAQDY